MLKKPQILFILVFCTVTFISAQQTTAGTSTAQINYSASYIIPSATGINMAVNVWGHVKKPGQYLVPYSINIDIVSLLSQAGGPMQGANLKKVILLRDIPDSTEPQKIIVDIEKFIETGNHSLLPTIEPNDTIIINQSSWNLLKSNTFLVQTAYSLVMMYFYLTNN